MTQTQSKSRQQAEKAFAATQTQGLARNRAVDERDAEVEARNEKTARLREARLEKETASRTAAGLALIAHRARG